jgi:hypothetical protein
MSTEVIQPNFAFNQGDAVRHKVTGFQGHIATRVEFLTGCNQYVIKSGKYKEGTTEALEVQVDESLIEIDPDGTPLRLVGTNTPQEAPKTTVANKRRTGGPQPNIKQQR